MADEDGMVDETPDGNEDALVGLSKEELVAELKRTRKEAASRRVANREVNQELEEYRKWKESQKSETDKLRERAEAAEREAKRLANERMQEKIAREVGLDPDLADRIRGESQEEMLADAKKLAEKYVGSADTGQIFTGKRGTPLRPDATPAEQFKHWIQNHP